MTMTAAAAAAPPRVPVQRWTENGLGATLTILAVAWALELPQRLNLALFNEQFLAGVLTLVLPLAFLTSSAYRKRTGRASWADLVLALASALIAGYVAVRYPEMQGRLVYRPLDGVILSA